MEILKLLPSIKITDSYWSSVRISMLVDDCLGTNFIFDKPTEHRIVRWNVEVLQKPNKLWFLKLTNGRVSYDLNLGESFNDDIVINSISVDLDYKQLVWASIKFFVKSTNEYVIMFGNWVSHDAVFKPIHMTLSGDNIRTQALFLESVNIPNNTDKMLHVVQDLNTNELTVHVFDSELNTSKVIQTVNSPNGYLYYLIRKPAEKPILVFR